MIIICTLSKIVDIALLQIKMQVNLNADEFVVLCVYLYAAYA